MTNDIKTYMQNIQLILIALLVLTLPYFIAPSFTLLWSVLIFVITITLNKVELIKVFKEKSILFLFLYIILTYLSATWSPAENIFGGNFKVNINAYLNYFFLIPGIYFANLSKKKIKLIFWLVIISPIVYLILYYTNFLQLTHLYSYDDTPFGSHRLYKDLFANIFLLFSSVFLFIKSILSLYKKAYMSSISFLLISVMVATSLFLNEITISRLVNLVFLITMLFICVHILPKQIKLSILFVFSLLSAFYIYSSSDIRQGFSEFQETYAKHQYDGSWGHRTKLAIYGIRMFTENPYFGRGITDVIDQMKLLRQEHPEDFQDPTIHFHDNHILILVQVGIFGYMLFLLFIYNFYSLKIKDKEIYMYKQTAIIVFLLLMFGEHYLQMVHTSSLFAIFIALSITYKKYEDEESLQSNLYGPQ